MEYLYENKTISLDLEQIHIEVTNSIMEDKSIEWCRWDEDTKILKIVFSNELSSSDKNKLDLIIEGI